MSILDVYNTVGIFLNFYVFSCILVTFLKFTYASVHAFNVCNNLMYLSSLNLPFKCPIFSLNFHQLDVLHCAHYLLSFRLDSVNVPVTNTCISLASCNPNIINVLHQTMFYGALFRNDCYIFFSLDFFILASIFPSSIYVPTIICVLQRSQLVLDFKQIPFLNFKLV